MNQTIKARSSVRTRSSAIDSGESIAGNKGPECQAPQSTLDVLGLSEDENKRFLRIVCQVWRIERHFELFQLLQGEAQFFFPHQILISAWGDFRGPGLQLDVISALPGVRTVRPNGCNVDNLVQNLHERWLCNGRQPILLEGEAFARMMQRGCECALHAHLRAMHSFFLHGVHSARDGTDTLYLAANCGPVVRDGDVERFRRLIDLVIAQIDVAFRRIAVTKITGISPAGRLSSYAGGLSGREEEILALVAQGRTNLEIAAGLAISSFTVKNHVQRIIRKLGATNRTEAAAKYRIGNLQERRRGTARSALRVADPIDAPHDLLERP